MVASTLERLKKLRGQTRIDALVALAYSNRRDEIQLEDYRTLGFPKPGLEECLIDAASANEPFVWPEEAPIAARCRWRCEIVGKLFRNEDYPPDAAVEILADVLSSERRAAILAGLPLTSDEWLTLEEIEEGGFADVFLFRCADAQGREIAFIRKVRDWGEASEVAGTFFDGEDPLASIVDEGDRLIRDDEVRSAGTPEWEQV